MTKQQQNILRMGRLTRYALESESEVDKKLLDSFDNMVNKIKGEGDSTDIENDDDSGDQETTSDESDNNVSDNDENTLDDDLDANMDDDGLSSDDDTEEELEFEESGDNTNDESQDADEAQEGEGETKIAEGATATTEEDVTITSEELNAKLTDLLNKEEEFAKKDEEIDDAEDKVAEESETGVISNESIKHIVTLIKEQQQIVSQGFATEDFNNNIIAIEGFTELHGVNRLTAIEGLFGKIANARISNKRQYQSLRANLEKVMWDIIYKLINTLDLRAFDWKYLNKKISELKPDEIAVNPPINRDLYSRITALNTTGSHETNLVKFAQRVEKYSILTNDLIKATIDKDVHFSDFTKSIDTEDATSNDGILLQAEQEYKARMEKILGENDIEHSTFYFCGAAVNEDGGLSVSYIPSGYIRSSVGYERLTLNDLRFITKYGITSLDNIKRIRNNFGSLVKRRIITQKEVEKAVKEVYGITVPTSFTGDLKELKVMDRLNGFDRENLKLRKSLARKLITAKNREIKKDFNSIKAMVKALNNGTNALIYFVKMYLK